jgi:hypothetical protein
MHTFQHPVACHVFHFFSTPSYMQHSFAKITTSRLKRSLTTRFGQLAIIMFDENCSTPWLLVGKRTIPTERPPLVSEF